MIAYVFDYKFFECQWFLFLRLIFSCLFLSFRRRWSFLFFLFDRYFFLLHLNKSRLIRSLLHRYALSSSNGDILGVLLCSNFSLVCLSGKILFLSIYHFFELFRCRLEWICLFCGRSFWNISSRSPSDWLRDTLYLIGISLWFWLANSHLVLNYYQN